MTGPAWLADTFAAIMIATAAYCVSRLVASWRLRRPTERDVDAVHVVMGAAMAGMLVPQLDLVPRTAWVAVFGLSAVWFGGQILRSYLGADPRDQGPRHHAPHLLASAAMLYMLLAVAAARGGSGRPAAGAASGATHYRTLALLFALALFGYVILTTDKLPALRPAVAGQRAPATPAPAASAPAGPGIGLAASGGSSAAPAGTAPATPVPAAAGSAVLAPAATAPAPVTAAAPALAAPALAAPAPAGGWGRFRPSVSGWLTGWRTSADSGSQGRRPISPLLAACCEIAMGVTMGYVLILML
jgi:hypothetical protein